ncbi:MAG: GntR family transcriptional regulator [Alicyclobacillus sp.]|nr:GntR family transcriptional regulator [Alicyclobacillus sp.]
MPFEFSKQQPYSLRHRVAEEIRKAILKGQIKPGDRLREQDVAEQMSISRGPVREAFSLLEREGLVVSHPYKETIVAKVTAEEVVEILLPIRYTLESFAVKKTLPEFTDREFRHLESLVSDMEHLADQADLLELVEKDVQFHRYFIQQCKQATVLALWDTIDMRVRLHFIEHGREYVDLHDIPREHRELLTVFQTQDVPRAIRELRHHIYELNTGSSEQQ